MGDLEHPLDGLRLLQRTQAIGSPSVLVIENRSQFKAVSVLIK
jgi:hypothetical protein